MWAFKLIDSISLEQNNKKYNPVEVFIDLDDSNTSNCLDQKELSIQLLSKIIAEIMPRVTVYQTKIEDFDNLDKLCISYVRNKLTQVVRQNKNIMVMTKKLEEVHINL